MIIIITSKIKVTVINNYKTYRALCHNLILYKNFSYRSFLLLQNTVMIMMIKIPHTATPPTAAPITTPLSLPLSLAFLFPGWSMTVELEAALVGKDG